MREGTIEVLRWIAVLPAAVAAAIICHGLTYWGYLLMEWISPFDPSQTRATVIAGGAATWAFVVAAGYTAPRFKWEASVGATVIAVLVAVVAALAAVGILVLSVEHETSRWILLLYPVACAVGAILGCRQSNEEWA